MHETKRLLERIDRLNAIGQALSAEQDNDRLLEMILLSAKDLTGADAGTLYTVTPDRRLRFEIVRTDSLGLSWGGTSGRDVPFDPIPLFDEEGHPSTHTVVARAAREGRLINIPDIDLEKDFDFSGTRRFDTRTGYKSRSFLAVPMRDHENTVIGVLQLINRRTDREGSIGPFTEEDEHLANNLASQAAIVLTKGRLLEDLRRLLEALTQLIATAIDEKSPYTGNHCRRVPILTMMLAEAADRCSLGALADFGLDGAKRYELELAAWLHDCGKLTTPQHLIDKRSKLESILDRMELVRLRIEILRRDARIASLESRLHGTEAETLRRRGWEGKGLRQAEQELDEAGRFLERCNSGDEPLSPADAGRIAELAERFSWLDATGRRRPLLNADEVEHLSVASGTLTEEEKAVVRNHAQLTIDMLRSLPLPRHLKNLPEYAGGHHERVDGRGYPRRLSREQTPIPARIMAIADIFEALTACDRPYKKAKTVSQALAIMGRMKEEGHIDPDLFDLFVRQQVYLDYARRFLEPRQIDPVDTSALPGFEAEAD